MFLRWILLYSIVLLGICVNSHASSIANEINRSGNAAEGGIPKSSRIPKKCLRPAKKKIPRLKSGNGKGNH